MQNFYLVMSHRKNAIASVLLMLSLALSACGFQLRGMTELSFKNVYIQGSTLTISQDLKRLFRANGVQIAADAESAELLLELLNEVNEKRILSLSGGGLVREYELNYRVNFRTREAANPIWSQVQSVQARRDFSYDDKVLLGKGEEEARLNADMRNDAIREVLRRLTAIKPAVK